MSDIEKKTKKKAKKNKTENREENLVAKSVNEVLTDGGASEFEIPPNTVMEQAAERVAVNPLLARAKMPGEDHRLPSGGIFYTNNELSDDVEDGEIHIHPLTTMDEINISSPALLYSGDGISQAIRECIPSVNDPDQLLAQDVDFILLCLRKVSYGPTFEFIKAHDGCKEVPEDQEPKEYTYQANLDKVIAASKNINVDDIATTTTLQLKTTNQIVKFVPLRFGKYMKLIQAQAQAARNELSETDQKNMILDHLAGVIASVDEISDEKLIREWLEVISASQVREINDKIESLASWGVDTDVKVKCRDCGEVMEVALPTSPLVLFSQY